MCAVKVQLFCVSVQSNALVYQWLQAAGELYCWPKLHSSHCWHGLLRVLCLQNEINLCWPLNTHSLLRSSTWRSRSVQPQVLGRSAQLSCGVNERVRSNSSWSVSGCVSRAWCILWLTVWLASRTDPSEGPFSATNLLQNHLEIPHSGPQQEFFTYFTSVLVLVKWARGPAVMELINIACR